jgi:glycosyltransferase involved in cell wall biosynthesis
MTSANSVPAVSVVMAVHNYAKYLSGAVRSILEQTYTDFEFIIVDDGSTDRTAKILERFAREDSRIRLLSQPNRGLTVSLRRGIESASAPLIARMDGDDISLPRRLEVQVRYLHEHPEVVALGGQILLIDPYGGYLGSRERELHHDAIDTGLLAGDGAAIYHPALMLRRSAYDQVGGYDEVYRTAQDLDLFLRLGEIGRLANVEDYLLLYRVHLSSTNSKKHSLQLKNREKIVRAACARRNLDFRTDRILAWPTLTISERYQSFAWQNLVIGQVSNARRHALNALIRKPLALRTWKLFACCMRGY